METTTISLSLQKGDPIQINQNITLKHPTLREIFAFGENNYWRAANLFTLKPYDFMVELDDSGINYQEVSDYDLFLQLYNIEEYRKNSMFLIGSTVFSHCVNRENGEVVLRDHISGITIDKLTYFKIKELIGVMNFKPSKNEFNPKNSFARKMLIDEQRRRKKKENVQSEKSSFFSNYIRFIVWNNTIGINYENVWDLKVYQFMEGVHSLRKTDHYKNTMIGLYTGNISPNDLNFEKINWESPIDIK